MRTLLITLFFLPSVAMAQAEYGVKGGLNISDVVMTNYINPDVESDLNLKLGLHAGLFLSAMGNEHLGMVAELLYSNKGVKGITNIHLHYITLPLLAQYQLADNIFAEVGPEFGYLFSARSRHGDMSSTYSSKFDLSLDAGIRFDAPKILFGVRYCAGLFSVRPSEDNGGSSNEKVKYQNRVLQLALGFKLGTFDR